MKKVIAFGTFDLFHPGHAAFLRQAKTLGERLTVVVARDENVKKIKGAPPVQHEGARQRAVISANIANEVILGDAHDFYKSIRQSRPDVIALGYDQRTDEKKLRKEFPEIRIVRLKAFRPEKYKTSVLKKS